ncbi:MAG: ChaN family lipoprotein [Pseudomonadota bacterium]
MNIKKTRSIEKKVYNNNSLTIAEHLAFMSAEESVYQEDYEKSLKKTYNCLDLKAFKNELKKADVVLIGDYRPFIDSKNFFMDLALDLNKKDKRKTFAALDWYASSKQAIMDEFLSSKKENEDLINKLYNDRKWNLKFKDFYVPVLSSFKKAKIPIFCIDKTSYCKPETRDEFSAAKLVNIIKANPKSRAIVSLGDNRLSAKHFPQSLKSLIPELNIMLVHLNIGAIYFKEINNGQISKLPAFYQLNKNEYCALTSSPVYLQQSFLNTFNEDYDFSVCESVKVTAFTNIDFICKFLGLSSEKYKKLKVASWDNIHLDKKLYNKEFKSNEEKAIFEHAQHSESFCLPQQNFIFIANRFKSHIAEEVCHYIKNDLDGANLIKNEMEYFYYMTMHEALGFLGSKLIYPKRKIQSLKVLKEEAQYDEIYCKIYTNIMLHKRLEKSEDFEKYSSIYFSDPIAFSGTVHYLGYLLGQALFEMYEQKKINKGFIKKLFFSDFALSDEARNIYFDLVEIIRQAKG